MFTSSRSLTRLLVAAVLLAALLVPAFTARAAQPAPRTDAATKGANWLKMQVNPDGGYGRDAKGAAKSGLTATNNAIYALVSAGVDPATVKQANGKSPLDYLQTNAATAAGDLNSVSKTILALRAVSLDPTKFGGINFYDKLNAYYNSASGQFVDAKNPSVTSHFFALLALSAGGKPIPGLAAAFLKTTQISDGSFGFTGTEKAGEGDTNDTAYGMLALKAAGLTTADGSVQRALAYLKTQQNDDGGFPFQKPSQYGTDSDANSTGVVIQAFAALNVDLTTFAPKGKNPLDALIGFQNSDGSFAFQTAVPGANELATVQAIPAAALQPLPVRAISTTFVPTGATPAPATTPATTAATTATTTVAATTAATTPATTFAATIAPATTDPNITPVPTTPALPGGLPETGRGGDNGATMTDSGSLLLVALVIAVCALALVGFSTRRNVR